MRAITALLVLVSLSPGQWVETTIYLPDSVSGLNSVSSLLFHAPNNTIYVGGGDTFLVAVDGETNAKLTKVAVGFGSHLLCSAPPVNKVYCSNLNGTSVTVIDGATNQPVKTFYVRCSPADLCYNGPENKLYCSSSSDSLVRVIDCEIDSVVAQIPVSSEANALCYNPQLNRLYCAHYTCDEVTVIDCTADTVVGVVWVRGVEPRDICFESASNCVYTANYVSGTVSVIDCAADTLLRLVAAGRGPRVIMAGPSGKVYCANSGDSTVSVISGGGVKTVKTGMNPCALSFDPLNNKFYCANYYAASVTVLDAAEDTVVAQVAVGSNPQALCYNPAGDNTYAGRYYGDVVCAIGGESNVVEHVLLFGPCNPGQMCYNLTNDHLYCLIPNDDLVAVIDGDSNRVLKLLPTGDRPENLVLSPIRNKVYIANSSSGTVSVLDCANDNIIANVATGSSPGAMCCSDDGKVYVVVGGGVAVIDGTGDTMRTVVPIGDAPLTLCYDRTDNKVYVGKAYGEAVSVIDAQGDSAVAAIPVPVLDQVLCWNQNYDKVYVCSRYSGDVAVIDCAGDTVLKNVYVATGLSRMYSDSVCRKVYCADGDGGYLRIIEATTDTFYRSLSVGNVTALLDNGRQGPANRLYCTDYSAGKVTVIRGYKTDSILRRISVGDEPDALAWNPTHSWMYVSNSGSSSITVIRDTLMVGIEEEQPQAASHEPQATVIRGVLELKAGASTSSGPSWLMDAAGRRVMSLHPGANNVSGLAPGVYFVRDTRAQARAFYRVVITR